MSLIGIDLGTTFCAVAALDDRGRPYTVPNRDGDILTPSAVYLSPDGSAVVGQPALDLALEQPERVATLIKRRMGLPDYGHAVAGREFRPETLSAVILKKLAQDAEAQLGPISGCVVTVPAYFDDTRRKATMDAGKIAGLNVIDIIDEPSAAALAYSVQQGDAVQPRTVLVYDLGGGTFDVTLVKLGRKRFQVLAIEGDVRLGGRDWDERLVNWAADQFTKQFSDDPRSDPQSVAQLYSTAERAKRTLSKVEQTSFTVSHAGHKLSLPLTRAEFETLTRDLLVRTRLTSQQVLKQAKLTWDAVDRVLMVGGSTHMPSCARMLAELTGKQPDHSLAVSEVVARGAAVHVGIASSKPANPGRESGGMTSELADVVEISVNAHSLGVEVRSGTERINDKLIPKNTQLPAASERVYFTAADNQSRVRVRILQGEAHQAEACIPVGECWIAGLPPNLPKGSRVRVKCGVASNGRIEVTATDETSGRAASASIHRPGGLSDDELARAAEWVSCAPCTMIATSGGDNKMTAVGDKRILMTETLLLRDNEVGKVEVPIEGTKLPVTIRFLSANKAEPTADWRYADGTLEIDCSGWGSTPLGGAMVGPHRIGDKAGVPIGFNFVHHKIGTINQVTLQFYLGGTYE